MILLLLLVACAHVPTWQRGDLVSRPMEQPVEPCEARMEAHVWAARESMAGASGATGPACGCN